MRIVVDINHPAHVHYFKNFIRIMRNNGHQVLITASEKDVTFKLLDSLDMDYVNLGSYGSTAIKKAVNLLYMDFKMYRAVRNFKPDIFIGFGSIRSTHVAKLMDKPSIIFDDTEHAKFEHLLYVPFASTILTPVSFNKNLGKKQIKFKGFMELAALHPKYFIPNPKILTELGLGIEDNLFVLRFAAYDATHDLKSSHFDKNEIPKVIEKLSNAGTIIISSEIDLDTAFDPFKYKLSPDKYHDLLYFSKIYIGESSTSAMESSVLGTPAIIFERITKNGKKYSPADISGVINEYQNQYGLLNCYYDESDVLEKIDQIISSGFGEAKKQAQVKAKRLLEDSVDVTGLMVWFIENYPESHKAMLSNPNVQESMNC